MKSFVKGLWSRTKSEPENRQLDHPRDLIKGDLVQLSDSFGLPPRLREQIFKVVGIVTYQFEHEFSTSFSLEGRNNDRIDLTINEEQGRATASFSLAIDREQVEQIFDLDEFSILFDPEQSAKITPVEKLDFDAWLADEYLQVSCAEPAYYYSSDSRENGPSEFEGDGEPFEYYSAQSADSKHLIEIEVYASGETDVSLTLNRPITDINELWPVKKEE